MIRENLSTTADNQLLETRGMINVKAFSGNQELKLRDGKKFMVHFPRDSVDRKKQMSLFYGQTSQDGNVNWNLDSQTLLRLVPVISGWSISGWPGGDSSIDMSFYERGEKNNILAVFYKNLDKIQIPPADDLVGQSYRAEFVITKKGKITNITMQEEQDSTGNYVIPAKALSYLTEYLRQLPTVEPHYMEESGKLVAFDASCAIYFHMGYFPRKNNEAYNKVFEKKYGAFKNNAIQSMNDAELNYYIFSSSQLGWINCDIFWAIPGQTVNYAIKVDPDSKPNIKLAFKNMNSIMTGRLKGNEYVFDNVPLNQPVKIIAISFKGSKPKLAITETTVSAQTFDKLDYKDFSLAELESQLK
jgi:hypothetical protein